MENVILTVHLIIALALIAVVLLQRSEGGGLGIGGGGGGLTSGRSSATALSKVTWMLAVSFLATSLTLTIIATQRSAEESVFDRLREVEEPAGESGTPIPPIGGGADAPLTPGLPALPPAED
ncbi:MAG: preprotein translocase subunit SecG [Pseudomonadota bacterium]